MHIHSLELLLQGANLGFVLLCRKLFASSEAMLSVSASRKSGRWLLDLRVGCSQFKVRLLDIVLHVVMFGGQGPKKFTLSAQGRIDPPRGTKAKPLASKVHGDAESLNDGATTQHRCTSRQQEQFDGAVPAINEGREMNRPVRPECSITAELETASALDALDRKVEGLQVVQVPLKGAIPTEEGTCSRVKHDTVWTFIALMVLEQKHGHLVDLEGGL